MKLSHWKHCEICVIWQIEWQLTAVSLACIIFKCNIFVTLIIFIGLYISKNLVIFINTKHKLLNSDNYLLMFMYEYIHLFKYMYLFPQHEISLGSHSSLKVADSLWKVLQNSLKYLGWCKKFLPDLIFCSYCHSDVASICTISCMYFPIAYLLWVSWQPA